MIGKKEKKNDEREKNQKKEKERKSNQSKKYGKAAYLQSRRGVISCWLTGWSLALLLGCVGYAFLTRGKAAGIVGGIAILSLMIDIYGIWNAIEGFESRIENIFPANVESGSVLCRSCASLEFLLEV